MVEDTYKKIKEIKQYAKDNKVPIMQDAGIDFLTTFIIKHQCVNILEVGTAVGYSAIMMALSNPKVKITSIERDEKRYLEAIKNVKKFGLEKRITLIFNDAMNVRLEDAFDLVFLDAAKSQNIKFFELFTFDSDETKKSYICYTDNTLDKDGNIQVYASVYYPGAETSRLDPIETDKEWQVINTILTTIQEEVRKDNNGGNN